MPFAEASPSGCGWRVATAAGAGGWDVGKTQAFLSGHLNDRTTLRPLFWQQSA